MWGIFLKLVEIGVTVHVTIYSHFIISKKRALKNGYLQLYFDYAIKC